MVHWIIIVAYFLLFFAWIYAKTHREPSTWLERFEAGVAENLRLQAEIESHKLPVYQSRYLGK